MLLTVGLKKVVELRPKKVEERLKAASNTAVGLILKVPLELGIESKLRRMVLIPMIGSRPMDGWE